MNKWLNVAKLSKFQRLCILYICVCCVLLCIANCTPLITSAANNASDNLTGQILINLFDNSDNFYEFKLSLPEIEIKNTYEGEIKKYKNEKGERKSIRFTDNYKKIFDSERWYNRQMEDKLKDIINTLDFGKLDKSEISSKIFLPDNVRYSIFFYPNKQFTHAVYSGCWPPKLINLKTKQISSPFNDDAMDTPVWDKSGRFVAYDATKLWSTNASAKYVIVNVSDGKTILRKKLEENIDGIDDIAFSPYSKHVAVLSYIKNPGFWPHEIFLIGAGHGIFNMKYYIEIYDFSGNLVYKNRVAGSYKNSTAAMGWVE